jgi:hypothetical protein
MADEDRECKSGRLLEGSPEARHRLDDRTVHISGVSLPIAGAQLDRALDRADGLACHAANGRSAALATATVRDGDSPAPRRREAEESFVHRGLGLLDSVSWRARRVDDGS